jgi:hypothetical protein
LLNNFFLRNSNAAIFEAQKARKKRLALISRSPVIVEPINLLDDDSTTIETAVLLPAVV